LTYIDSSVVLSRLFGEAVFPPDAFWLQRLVSSRLLRYEVMNRVNFRASSSDVIADAEDILDRVELLDLAPEILARALRPFPINIRTLDGLHLATMDYLSVRNQTLRLASYDKRMLAAASALGIPLAAL
jgi:hypothetical protein